MYHVDEIAAAILKGLRRVGKKKSFMEILAESGVRCTSDRLLEIANDLESRKLIQSVTYQLPVSIRAELSKTGKQFADTLE